MIMRFMKQQKSFVSEIDKFITQFDARQFKKADARVAEENKYSEIFNLRDNKRHSPGQAIVQWDKA